MDIETILTRDSYETWHYVDADAIHSYAARQTDAFMLVNNLDLNKHKRDLRTAYMFFFLKFVFDNRLSGVFVGKHFNLHEPVVQRKLKSCTPGVFFNSETSFQDFVQHVSVSDRNEIKKLIKSHQKVAAKSKLDKVNNNGLFAIHDELNESPEVRRLLLPFI